MRKGFLPLPHSTFASLNRGGVWQNTIASAGFCYLAAGQGFLEPFFHILIKAAGTNYGLKGTNILIAC